MAKWNYTLRFGTALREAIKDEDIEMIIKCLIACYRELLNKLSDEDRDWKEFDIEDAISSLECYDIYEECGDVDDYLHEFYDICDDVRAWVTI
jgi:hypothetical protein